MRNNEPTRNSEEPPYYVMYLKRHGDWSPVPGDGWHIEPKVFFIKGGALGIDIGGKVIVKPLKQWVTPTQRKSWFSALFKKRIGN